MLALNADASSSCDDMQISEGPSKTASAISVQVIQNPNPVPRLKVTMTSLGNYRLDNQRTRHQNPPSLSRERACKKCQNLQAGVTKQWENTKIEPSIAFPLDKRPVLFTLHFLRLDQRATCRSALKHGITGILALGICYVKPAVVRTLSHEHKPNHNILEGRFSSQGIEVKGFGCAMQLPFPIIPQHLAYVGGVQLLYITSHYNCRLYS
ncbi:hypothetical protein F5Y17DRAFT_372419 [Xylariaceae sp. FL0594]|nr:hypothetical protein F5Y17DRAFT_372419 [Xylariaceae sp. FL0594]